jgi:hypothetical protein
MAHRPYQARESLTVTSAPKPKRGWPPGRRSTEGLEEEIRARPGGVATLAALRQRAMLVNGRFTDEDYKAQLRAVLEGGED